MQSLAESAHATTPPAADDSAVSAAAGTCEGRATDFMSVGYSLIGEPLNLLAPGQAWFTQIVEREFWPAGEALILGATPWLVRAMCSRVEAVKAVDHSQAMLTMLTDECRDSVATGKVEVVLANWRQMPVASQTTAIVLGDNSLSFLSYPDDWHCLCATLAERMISGSRLVLRTASVPQAHAPLTVPEVVEEFLGRPVINFTEVRAHLLFAHWNAETFAIPTEDALRTFEENRPLFDRLLQRDPTANDLLTVAKYRNTGAVYYAPPLESCLEVLRKYFAIHAIHFGPYALSEYFPLIVATKQ